MPDARMYNVYGVITGSKPLKRSTFHDCVIPFSEVFFLRGWFFYKFFYSIEIKPKIKFG